MSIILIVKTNLTMSLFILLGAILSTWFVGNAIATEIDYAATNNK